MYVMDTPSELFINISIFGQEVYPNHVAPRVIDIFIDHAVPLPGTVFAVNTM
jgi:hypothetical protein